MKEARLYQVLNDNQIQCQTCAHYCVLNPGKKGICAVHQNIGGKLFSLAYGKAIAMHVDPIEKKPLFHLLPGSRAFSIATAGCNMHCHHCQNADISQMPGEKDFIGGEEADPGQILDAAVRESCEVIAYTYTEPAVYWDYAYDICISAHEKGILNVFVTNGYLSKESLSGIAPYLDAANVDLKFFNDQNYKQVCGARLAPVLETIEHMRSLGIWVEVTTLLIPGLNDTAEELKQIAEYIVGVDPEMPWHISRFYPTYRMTDRSPTAPSSIQKARQIGLEYGVKYVYSGNLPDDPGESTFCHQCKERLIHRSGYQIRENRIRAGSCPACGTKIPGLWG